MQLPDIRMKIRDFSGVIHEILSAVPINVNILSNVTLLDFTESTNVSEVFATYIVQYFLPIVLLFLCALLLTVVSLLCIVLLSCVYLCYLMCIVLLCVYCCLTYFSCRIAG